MMFKKFSEEAVRTRFQRHWEGCGGQARRGKFLRTFVKLGVAGLIVSGCATLRKPLPAVNVQAPGWVVHQGQAVWKLPDSKQDIAGDVTVALGPEGSSFVQFSKTPFPLVIGQTSGNRWQMEFPAQNKRYNGSGAPPKRAMWLYLPRAIEGKTLPQHWTWSSTNGNWRLANP